MKFREAAEFLSPIGTLSGGVIGRTKYARFIRKKYPRAAATSAQLKARDDWRITDAVWQALSPERKTLWNTWKPWYKCYGYNLFMKVNYPRQRSGDPLLPEPPDFPPWV